MVYPLVNPFEGRGILSIRLDLILRDKPVEARCRALLLAGSILIVTSYLSDYIQSVVINEYLN